MLRWLAPALRCSEGVRHMSADFSGFSGCAAPDMALLRARRTDGVSPAEDRWQQQQQQQQQQRGRRTALPQDCCSTPTDAGQQSSLPTAILDHSQPQHSPRQPIGAYL
jgi:hypothetical protein